MNKLVFESYEVLVGIVLEMGLNFCFFLLQFVQLSSRPEMMNACLILIISTFSDCHR